MLSTVLGDLNSFSRTWAVWFGASLLDAAIVLALAGIVYVAILTILGKYCPLTILENDLRGQYDAALTYPGSFVIHYVERIVYPEANFLIFVIPTTIIAVFTVLMFMIKPPTKIKRLFGIR